MNDFSFKPIGYIRSCFIEKFGVPRQAGLVPEAVAVLDMAPEYQQREAFRELASFSHIWLLFVFHQCLDAPWRPTVRPPRLGGNQRVGVFASRSGFRPNPIGQSAVELTDIEMSNQGVRLHLKGVDLVDGTPVLDIKPYLPYADNCPDATGGYARQQPEARFGVSFTEDASRACREWEKARQLPLKQLIIDLLAIDPRPGYADATQKREYGMRLYDVNVQFSFKQDCFHVKAIEPYKASASDTKDSP